MSESSMSGKRSSKRRIHEIDDTIEDLTHAVKAYSDFKTKSEFECLVLTAKLKREKIRALSAFTKSQIILAEMEILIAESDLSADLERLKNDKKIKLDCSKENSTPKTSRSSMSTSKSTKRKGQSLSQPAPASKKKKSSSHNTSTETVIVESIKENLPPNVSSKSSSDTDESLTNSLKAEFLKSYSGNPAESQSPTTHISRTSIPKLTISQSQKRKSKTVAELEESIENIRKEVMQGQLLKTQIKNEPETTSTCVPIRHQNLPVVITRSTPMTYACNEASTSRGLNLYLSSSTNMDISGTNCRWFGQKPTK